MAIAKWLYSSMAGTGVNAASGQTRGVEEGKNEPPYTPNDGLNNATDILLYG